MRLNLDSEEKLIWCAAFAGSCTSMNFSSHAELAKKATDAADEAVLIFRKAKEAFQPGGHRVK